MINNMQDSKLHVRMENLDDVTKISIDTDQTPVDEKTSVSDNSSSSVRVNRSGKTQIKVLDLETKKEMPMQSKQKKIVLISLILIAVIAGIGTGYGAFKLNKKNNVADSPQATQQIAGDNIKAGDVFGVKDDLTFKDNAEGYLAAGGAEDEGSHRLLREGGESQTVYLTSSITDLDKMVGMKVKVWGETFKGQKAGWLMDVGRVQVIEVEAEAPVEAE